MLKTFRKLIAIHDDIHRVSVQLADLKADFANRTDKIMEEHSLLHQRISFMNRPVNKDKE